MFETLPLRVSYAVARTALRDIMESAIRDTDGTVWRLRAGLGPAMLSKEVRIFFSRDVDSTRFDEIFSVRWVAENGGPFPEFNGWLCVQYDSGNVALLELRGQYLPPLGAVGKGFDLVLGQRIASESCKHLLHLLADRMEAVSPA